MLALVKCVIILNVRKGSNWGSFFSGFRSCEPPDNPRGTRVPVLHTRVARQAVDSLKRDNQRMVERLCLAWGLRAGHGSRGHQLLVDG